MSSDFLERAKVSTKSGLVYQAHNQELLENLPPDMVEELTRREMQQIEKVAIGRSEKLTVATA
jgi:hypothetical protein